MTGIQINAAGDLRPDWLVRLEDAISEARAAGWNHREPIVFEGHPYVWDGEPRMATWTVEQDPDAEEPQS